MFVDQNVIPGVPVPRFAVVHTVVVESFPNRMKEYVVVVQCINIQPTATYIHACLTHFAVLCWRPAPPRLDGCSESEWLEFLSDIFPPARLCCHVM